MNNYICKYCRIKFEKELVFMLDSNKKISVSFAKKQLKESYNSWESRINYGVD